MATKQSFIEYAVSQIDGVGAVRYKKMFGEYLIYVNERPTLLVCDNMVFVKMLPCVEGLMDEKGFPYKGAKEHYILNIDDAALSHNVARLVADNTPLPKKKK